MGTFVDIQAPLGAQPENDDVRLYNGTGSSIPLGGCVAFDEQKTSSDGFSTPTSSNTVGFVTAVRATIAGDKSGGGVVCWALEEVPAGAVGRFRVAGICQVRLAADLAANTTRNLSITAGATTMTATAITEKCVAKALTATAVSTTPPAIPLCNAWVDGRNGFGGTVT